MAKEGSVAPKERINIVYKPATGDAQEQVELPLKLVFLGDFTMREDETALEDRELLQIDKDNFNDVLREMKLALDINVRDRLSESEGDEEKDMPVHLEFNNIKDFSPESIGRQVPEMQKLLELREALESLKGPLANTAAFRKKLQGLLDDEEKRKAILDEIIKDQGED